MLAVVAGLIAGLAPAAQSTSRDLVTAIKAGRRGRPRHARLTRGSLLVAQTALSMTMLVAAGLLVLSLVRLHTLPLGFDPDGLVTISLPGRPGRRARDAAGPLNVAFFQDWPAHSRQNRGMSITTNHVRWFEIPVRTMSRAMQFYQTAFGVTLQPLSMGGGEMAMFPMDPTGPGTAGSLVADEGYTPSHQGSVVYFEVDDIKGTLARIGQAGGKTLLPRMAIGEFGFIAHFEDTEGNRVALHSDR